MKVVTKYEARDGKVYDTEEEALARERLLDLEAELYDSDISWQSTSAKDVAEWILQNYDITPKPSKGKGGRA